MIIIGEKINASRPEIRQIIEDRDSDSLVKLAKEQASVGADFIGVSSLMTTTMPRQQEINELKIQLYRQELHQYFV